MKRPAFLLSIGLGLASTATSAQIHCTPDGTGGMNCFDPSSGTSRQIRPNGAGGYDVIGPPGTNREMRPNSGGGYDVIGPPGTSRQIRPNSGGGYDIDGRR